MAVESNDPAKANLPKEPEYFDPASVPLMKWSDYEAIQKDNSSNSDSKSYGYTPSAAGTSVYAESVAAEPIAYPKLATPPTLSMPSDEEILQEIRHILSTTDLMKITKKSVRDRLTRLFGVDISSKKEFIHHCIDSILKGEL
jgi:hypothetical protein